MTHVSAWLDCAEPGCPNGTAVTELRHLDNLTARDHYCPRHATRAREDTDA